MGRLNNRPGLNVPWSAPVCKFDKIEGFNPLIAKGILNAYVTSYENNWLAGMRAKCGLFENLNNTVNEGKTLIDELLDVMAVNNADFTLTFYYLSTLDAEPSEQVGEQVGEQVTPINSLDHDRV